MNLIKECKLQIISTKVSFFTFSNILHTHFYLISLYIQSKTNTILRFKIINKKILKKLNKIKLNKKHITHKLPIFTTPKYHYFIILQ